MSAVIFVLKFPRFLIQFFYFFIFYNCYLTLTCDIILFRGYIEAIREIEQQLQTGTGKIKFDDIVVACGRFHSTPSVSFCCYQ
jgi:hypothetical protein